MRNDKRFFIWHDIKDDAVASRYPSIDWVNWPLHAHRLNDPDQKVAWMMLMLKLYMRRLDGRLQSMNWRVSAYRNHQLARHSEHVLTVGTRSDPCQRATRRVWNPLGQLNIESEAEHRVHLQGLCCLAVSYTKSRACAGSLGPAEA